MSSNSGETSWPAHLRPDALATSVAILLVVSVVQRAVGFGRGVLFCRWLSPEELGHWEMAYSFLLLAAPITVLGVPGCFGRYLERYRSRNQLQAFLRRTVAWTGTLVLAAVGVILCASRAFSELIFGEPNKTTMVTLLAVCLAAVILHHFLEALFAALRMFRIVSIMHFCQSMAFAAVSLGLLYWLPIAAEGIVLAYGVACALSAAGTLLWMRRPVRSALAESNENVSHATFWPPLLRFAVWVWITNLLCHLFGVVDRYMIVHHSGMDNATALAQVGHYHSSRIIPLLFISVADLLAGVVMPYLSHDWEKGNRQAVSDRINFVVKMTSLAMFAGGVVVLWFAPTLFRVAFDGKYDDGLAVLPWTLTYCIWYALLLVAQNYIWCAERMKLGTLPLAAGLAVNILLNLVLLPIWGLLGAVVATTAATAIALAVLYAVNHRAGMQLDRGMVCLSVIPLALCCGPPAATALLLATLVAAFGVTGWVNLAERAALTDWIGERTSFWRSSRESYVAATPASGGPD